MKYRKGFVTNSSSSSFIIGYNSMSALIGTITTQLYSVLKKEGEGVEFVGEDIALHIEKILNAKIDKNEFNKKKKYYIDELFYDYIFARVVFEGREIRNYDSSELRNLNSKVGRFWYKLRVNQVNEMFMKASKYKYLLEVEVSDDTVVGSILENNILPKMNGLILKQSFH